MGSSLHTVRPCRASGMTTLSMGVGGVPTGEFAPSSLTGLILWMDATKISGIASNTSLSSWTDSSASAANATQTSAASQPKYFTGIQNNLPAVQFFGAQFMESAASLVQPCTVACASSASTFGGNPMVFGGSLAGNGFNGLFVISNKYAGFAGTVLSGSSATVNAWVSLIGQFSGSSTTLSVSGVTFSGNAGTSTSTAMRIGGTSATQNLWTGYLGEGLVYNRLLTETERGSLETYMRTKWGTL